jgi:inner membrane protein
MTQRTHDLIAVALVSYRFLAHPPIPISAETIIGIAAAAIIGAIIPDIDNVASPAWQHKLFFWDGKITRDFLQGHRHLSHSLLGIFLFTWVLGWALSLIHLPNFNAAAIKEAFMLAQLSHLLADSLTIEGVPWLFPIPFKFGFPPFAFLRMKTGGWIERLLVFPSVFVLTLWIYYYYRGTIAAIIKGA